MNPNPFPHAIKHRLWPDGWLRAIRDEFPPYDDPRWIHYPMAQEIGKKAGPSPMWGPATREWFAMIRAPQSVR